MVAKVARVQDIAESLMLAKREGELGRTIFFIGAGCSISAGIPTAPQIAQRIVRELCGRFNITPDADTPFAAYEALVGRGRLDACLRDGLGNTRTVPVSESEVDWYKVYDHSFDRHLRAPNDVRDLFGAIVGESAGTVNWAHLCLGELASKWFVSTILTTNFDQLVLSGMTAAGLLPVVCDGIESLNRISPNPTHPQLVELHGSRHTYRLRNRPSEVASVAREDPAISAILGLFNHATTFIAVGYGGREDGVMDLLVRAASTYPDKNLFWTIYEDDPGLVGEKVQRFLASSNNAFVVPGQDADLFFLNLCRETGVGAPTAVSSPLARSAAIVRSVRASRFSDADIEAEVARAEELLEELSRSEEGFASASRPENVAAQMRTSRLAGRPEEAISLVEGADPEEIDVQVLREWARGLEAVAETQENKDILSAVETYERACAIGLKLIDRAPEDRDALLLYSRLKTSLGDSLENAGELRRAHEVFKETVDFDRSLAERYKNDEDVQAYVADSLERLSSLFADMGDLEEALRNVHDALAIREKVYSLAPSERTAAALAGCYNTLARIQAEEGDQQGAEKSIESAVETMRMWASNGASSTTAWFELASALDYKAALKRRASDTEAAKDACKEALELWERIAAESDTPDHQRGVMVSYARMADIYAAERDIKEAQNWFEKALTLSRRGIERDPNNSTAKDDLLVTASKYMGFLIVFANWRRALPLAEETLQIAQHLANQDSSPKWNRSRGIHHIYLADVLCGLGDLDRAQEELTQSVNIFQKLARTNVRSADAQRDHSIALERLAEVTRKRGQHTQALHLYKESFSIAKALASDHPDNVQLASDLAITEQIIARMENEVEDDDE